MYNQCDSFFGTQISNSKITSPNYLCLSYQTISYHVLFIQTVQHKLLNYREKTYLVEKCTYLFLNNLGLLQHFLANVGQLAVLSCTRYAKDVRIRWPFQYPVLTYDKFQFFRPWIDKGRPFCFEDDVVSVLYPEPVGFRSERGTFELDNLFNDIFINMI